MRSLGAFQGSEDGAELLSRTDWDRVEDETGNGLECIWWGGPGWVRWSVGGCENDLKWEEDPRCCWWACADKGLALGMEIEEEGCKSIGDMGFVIEVGVDARISFVISPVRLWKSKSGGAFDISSSTGDDVLPEWIMSDSSISVSTEDPLSFNRIAPKGISSIPGNPECVSPILRPLIPSKGLLSCSPKLPLKWEGCDLPTAKIRSPAELE